MRLSTHVITLGFLGALGICGLQSADAAVLTIYLNQATESGVRELAAAFEKATGNKVDVSFQGGAALNQKINTAPGDLASLTLAQFDAFVKNGRVVPGSVVEYGRVGNGVAIKAGAQRLDISTPDAFKRALLSAQSIGHTNAGTGPFNTNCSRSSASTTRSSTRSESSTGGPSRRPSRTTRSRSASSRPM
jgi:molybdate transport system substrate-binding protein